MPRLSERAIREMLTLWQCRGVEYSLSDYLDVVCDEAGKQRLDLLRSLADQKAIPMSHRVQNAYLAVAAGSRFWLAETMSALVVPQLTSRLGHGAAHEWNDWRQALPELTLRPKHVRRIARDADCSPPSLQELVELAAIADPDSSGLAAVWSAASCDPAACSYLLDAFRTWHRADMVPRLLVRLEEELNAQPATPEKMNRFTQRMTFLRNVVRALGGKAAVRRLLGVAALWLVDLFQLDLSSTPGAMLPTGSPTPGYCRGLGRRGARALRRAIGFALLESISSNNGDLDDAVRRFVYASQCLNRAPPIWSRAALRAVVAEAATSDPGATRRLAALALWSASPVAHEHEAGSLARRTTVTPPLLSNHAAEHTVLELLAEYLWDLVTTTRADLPSLQMQRETLRHTLRMAGRPATISQLL